MLAAIVLGVIQGVTEFLPVSSTAHLVLLPWFFQWQGTVNTLTFDVALHAGTLLSLLIAFRKDIVEIVMRNRRMGALLFLGTIPAGIAGVFLEDYIAGPLRSPALIALMLVVFGMVMYFAENFRKTKKMEGMTALDALLVGLAQAVAILPGVSRSGITISAGLMRGVRRVEAARFSFMLSIPVIAGATLLEGVKLPGAAQNHDFVAMGVGFAASLVTGLLAIRFMLRYLTGHNMNAFVAYRFVLAAVIMGWLWFGG